MIVDLVRHGDTGRRGHFDGSHDPPLLADACAGWSILTAAMHWTHAISSPLQRARQTARAVMGSDALPLSVAEDWAEWHFGDWEGLSPTDVARHDAGRVALANFQRDPVRFPPPNAEPWQAFQKRVERALRNLATLDDSALVLVVSHAGPIRQAIALACGLPMQSIWAMRIDYGTRVRLHVGLDSNDRLWGELIELRQACD